MEAGKKRLVGDTARAANADEVKELLRVAIAFRNFSTNHLMVATNKRNEMRRDRKTSGTSPTANRAR